MKISGMLIRETDEIIFSRTRHDFKRDKTGEYAIDGGQEMYTRLMFKDINGFDSVTFELDVTEQQLYDDWNKQTDKLGSLDAKDVKYQIKSRDGQHDKD